MKSFFRLLRWVKPYRGWLLLSIISQILMAAFTVFSIPLLQPVLHLLFYEGYDQIEKPTEALGLGNLSTHLKYQFAEYVMEYPQSRALLMVCCALVLMFAMKNLFRYIGHYCLIPVRNGMVRDIRKAMYERMLALPMSYYSDERKGDLLSRITNDIQLVENSMISVIMFVFREPFILVGALLYMLFISPHLCLFVFVLMLVITFLIGSISRTLKKKSRRAQNQLGELVSITDETLSGMRVVKAYGAEGFVSRRFDELNDGYRQIMTRILRRRDLSSPLTEVMGISVVALLLWYGGQMVFSTDLDAPTFMSFIMAFYFVIEPAKNFSSAYYNIQKGMGGLDRVEALLAQEMEEDGAVAQMPTSSPGSATTLQLQDVWFRYPSSDLWVLREVSFTINAGKCIALVGSSGAGKSTIADLIPRFYDVTRGSIRINDQDISDWKLTDLRSLMGIVSQDPILFHDSIKRNITLGGNYTEEQIIQAARAANAHDFITATEAGYETVIGDRGMKLSGGQRQRLSIARAILKNPPLLILDEATSALDSESEHLVQAALDAVMSDRTTLVIAHRLSTIYKADEILILEEGQVIERGTHEELLAMDGKYRQFVDFQAFTAE